MSIAEVTQIVGACGVIASLSILSWQSRQLVKQMKVGNSVATLAAMNTGLDRLHSFIGRLADDPSLRQYFYGGVKVDELDPMTRNKVESLAEMLADILDYQLTSAKYLPSVKDQDDWSDFSVYLLERSPVLRDLIEGSPDEWWKEIANLRHSHGPIQPIAPAVQPEAGDLIRRNPAFPRFRWSTTPRR
ncbi:hypothetical protein [Actinoplanes subglobosus]|uniref:Uncharacterized protein n=1 Tax=Actinoplanes subglobosus TaxID=1547892 RepID=A0ABV8J5L8_9ACTN